MPFEIVLPEMGEGVIEGTLTRWLVKEGDEVEAFDPLAEVETDKVTTEILSEVDGIVLALCVAEGETIPVDTVVAHIEPAGGQQAGQTAEGEKQSANGSSQGLEVSPDLPGRSYNGRISPVVGRIAAEHEVDLNQVEGTGKDGRITKRDILSYVEQRDAQTAGPAAPPVIEASAPAREEKQAEVQVEAAKAPPAAAPGDVLLPLDGMRRAIAAHMVQSKRTSPHVTTVFEFDFSAVSDHRRRNKSSFAEDGARLTFTVYIISAVVQALKEHRLANSVWTDDGIILKQEINIGMAVAVPDGLIVPVIKDADGLNLLGLARQVNELAEKARSKRLAPGDVQGGTFSLTNHGTSGSLFATPIINQPQAGILGVGKIEKRVKVINDAIAIRPLAYASFTFDHRILDGATADAFVSSVKDRLENWA